MFSLLDHTTQVHVRFINKKTILRFCDRRTRKEIQEKMLSVLTICIFAQGGCPEHCWNLHDIMPANVPISVVECDLNSLHPANDTLYVARGQMVTQLSHRVSMWKRSFFLKNVGVFVMADEYNADKNSNALGPFDFALRNYYFPVLKNAGHIHLGSLGNLTCGYHENVITEPAPRLGYFWLPPLSLATLPLFPRGNLVPGSRRKFSFCFVGSEHADRRDMSRAFEQVEGGKIVLQKTFRGDLGTGRYAIETLGNCAIALIPRGNNVETIRMMDALKMGAVPALVHLAGTRNNHFYIEQFFEPPPFIVENSWVKVRDRILQITARDSTIDDIQSRTQSWFSRYRECVRQDMHILLTSV